MSRARIVSENSFGILVNRFQLYRAPIRLQPDKAVAVVYSTLALHNWLTNKSENDQMPSYDGDGDGDGCGSSLLPFASQDENVNVSSAAQKMREKIKNYFNNEGARSWQLSKI